MTWSQLPAKVIWRLGYTGLCHLLRSCNARTSRCEGGVLASLPLCKNMAALKSLLQDLGLKHAHQRTFGAQPWIMREQHFLSR